MALTNFLLASVVEVERIGRAIDHADGFVAEGMQQRVVAAGLAGDDRELETEIGVLLHEGERTGAGKALADDVATGHLRKIGRVVRRAQRRPQLVEHAAAVLFERRLEAALLLVTEGEIEIDRDRLLLTHFLGGVVTHRLHRLRRTRRRAQEIGVGAALGEIVGAGEAERRRLVLANVIGDGEQFESRQRAEDDVDLVALDQFLRLGLGAGRLAAGVGGEEFDLAAGHLVVVLLQPGEHALFHLDAALRERAGLDGQQAELERRGLRDGRCRKFERRAAPRRPRSRP